jgi:hypothetical protein
VGPVIFVEVLDRRGRVAQRVRFDALPVTIGRAYHNAVILDDRYVSPEHARLEWGEGDGIVAVDLGSDNGLFEAGRLRRQARIAIAHGTRLRLGDTVLRIARADQPVSPAVPEPLAGHPLGRVVLSRRGALWLCVAALVSQFASSWLATYADLKPARALNDAIVVGVVLATWAAGWALATRLRTHRAMFLPHLALASVAAVAGDVVWAAASVAETAAPALLHGALAWWGLAATVAIGAALVYGHLAVVATLPPRRRALWAGGVVLTAVALVWFADYAERDRDALDLDFVGGVRPVPAAVVQARELEAFVAGLDRLRGIADTAAARPR